MRTKIAMSVSSGFCQRVLLLTSLPRVTIDASMAAVVPVRSIPINSLGILLLPSMQCMKKNEKKEGLVQSQYTSIDIQMGLCAGKSVEYAAQRTRTIPERQP